MQPTIEIDSFTNDRVASFREICTGTLCSDFKVINQKTGYWYLSYVNDDWIFAKEIWLKIENEKDTLKLSGNFEKDTDGFGSIRETLTVKIDKKIYSFIERSLGKTIQVRVYGKQYSDISVSVKGAGEQGQWGYLLDELKL